MCSSTTAQSSCARRVTSVILALALAAPGASVAAPQSPRSVDPWEPGIPEANDGRAEEVKVPPGVPGDWWSQVQRSIEESEYRVGRREGSEGQGAYQALNRAQHLRTYFTAEGVRLVPGTEGPGWEVGLTLTSVGAGKERVAAGAAKLETSGNRVEYQRRHLTEWYVNDERGLEQGFIVGRRPMQATRKEPLRLVLSVSGNTTPRLSADGKAVEFLAPGGALAVRYAELVAIDDRGTALASRMELAGCGEKDPCAVHLVVEDGAAIYPLTIDPLATSPSWTVDGEGGGFGWSVATAGDVNGDGYADVIVGAPWHGSVGRAYVYHGSDAGLSATPAWTAEGDQTYAQFGTWVGAAGDVNGDGYADVVLGAPNYASGQRLEGRAYLYHGSATGLSATPAWTAEGDQVLGFFGSSVATAGDVNGDGYADVIVGAPGYDDGPDGEAYVYHGSASGLSAAPDWVVRGSPTYRQLGQSVGTAGDVNGDGYADVIVGAPWGHLGRNWALVYHGSGSGLSTTPNWIAEGGVPDSNFGWSAGTAGDVNGDGYADVIIGASRHWGNGGYGTGRACVYHGSASGLSPTPNWEAEGAVPEAGFGQAVATAGDVNGDGYADVIVGAVSLADPPTYWGSASVYYGSAQGLSTAATWTAAPSQPGWGMRFGWSAGTAGDVNGDGYSDIVVGAPSYGASGRAYVFHGSADAPAAAPGWTISGDQADAWLGYSVETAGDVNGDGYADVIVAAPSLNGEGRVFVFHGSAAGLLAVPSWTVAGDQDGAGFGWSVGTAGDVNGDGYADVIVGAPHYDSGQENRGRAYVFHGSAAGLMAAPSWTAEGDLGFAGFGRSVGTAGDVNGDGYADVITGATGSGRAYVYLGSAVGLSGEPSWSALSPYAWVGFGHSVGTAGDVNGDGYADVIVGAPGMVGQEGGHAYVYHGSPLGLSLGPAWTLVGDFLAEAGSSVGTAGDVNGDGYADVIVGAPGYDNARGRAVVCLGSATGLMVTPTWTVEGDREGAVFGTSVGTAGDTNGDGRADVIVGGPDSYDTAGRGGRAYTYWGSATGLSVTPGWTAEGDQGARLGFSVAAAGDMNGDGYADVIVGAPYHNGTNLDEGAALLYHGNSTPGRPVVARQLRGGGSRTPVQPWGASWDREGFRVRLTNTSPLGRQRVKVQVEACPSGKVFGDPACTTATSPEWEDVKEVGVTLSASVSGLTEGKLYRWRARTLYAPHSVTQAGITAPPNPSHGPWRRLSGQGLEADIRVLDLDVIFGDGFEGQPIAGSDEGLDR